MSDEYPKPMMSDELKDMSIYYLLRMLFDVIIADVIILCNSFALNIKSSNSI